MTTRLLVASGAIAIVLLAAVTVRGAAAPAAAHARVSGSAPADGEVVATPPAEVSLVLDAKPATVEGDPLQVYAPDGRRVDTGGATVSADARTLTVPLDPAQDLPAGEYRLMYRVVSADSHIIGGLVTFTVEQATAAAGPPVAGGDAEPAPAGDVRSALAPRADQPPSGQAADAARLAPGRPDDVRPRAAATAAAALAVLGTVWRLLRRRSRRRFEAELAPPPMPARRRPEPRPTGSGVGPPGNPVYRPVTTPMGSESSRRSPGTGAAPERRRMHAGPAGAPRRRGAAR
jgi:methionine-rich copper-binding protein CopC